MGVKGHPTNIGIASGTHTLSVATPVVVIAMGGGGVDVWVAPKVFISLTRHLHSVSAPG